MSTTYNDFKPETRSLILRLRRAGFRVTGGNNGEVEFELTHPDFLDELLATDETWLYIERDGFNFSLYLVLGNSPGELVNDYRYSFKCEGDETGAKALADLDAVTEAHYEAWIDRKQPTRTV